MKKLIVMVSSILSFTGMQAQTESDTVYNEKLLDSLKSVLK